MAKESARPHPDLYRRSNEHRLAHGTNCTIFPTPRARLWSAIAAALPAQRILEVGCGIGYGAACLADANPECIVDTIEGDAAHADLAEREFNHLELSTRITVLRGDAELVLPTLKEPYDLVIEDAGIDYDVWLPELTRLTYPDGMLITANLAGHLAGWRQRLPARAITLVRAQPDY